MHWPAGRVGLWSKTWGETPDHVTRGLRLYPIVDQIVYKGGTDWRSSINASPSLTKLSYSPTSPAKGSTAALTVTPDVSIFNYHFNNVTSFGAVGMAVQELGQLNGYPSGGTTWSHSTWTYINPQTVEVTLSDGTAEHTHYFYVKFSAPATGHGTVNSAGTIRRGGSTINGDGIGGYLTFAPGTVVQAAVALSMTSMNRAQANFQKEFATFDFAGAVANLKNAWNRVLGKIDVRSAPSATTTKQIYTGLYTVYANIIDVTDNPTGYVPVAPSARLITVGSAVGWEYEGGGYLATSFDQGPNTYSLLTLVDPTLMTDMLNTYLSQYNHDGYLFGNWDPFSNGSWSDQQFGYFSYYYLRAKLQGVTGVNYKAAETAILNTMGMNATSRYLAHCKFYSYGYIPADICSSNYLERGLFAYTQLEGLAHLAYLNGDTNTYNTYAPYGSGYNVLWNPASRAFQGKNSNGSWAPLNGGLVEGSATAYAFVEYQDGIGLAKLYGDSNMASLLMSTYGSQGGCPTSGWNDFQMNQPYMAYSANSPSTAQEIVRTQYVPAFASLNMWEDCGGGVMFYTDNASTQLLGNLGIYPLQSPGAQWVLNGPAVAKAVIHGAQDVTIQANNTSARSTPYVSSVQVNGKGFPSQFISAETLVKQPTTLTFGMSASPARIGAVYVTGADGEILSAATDGRTYLQWQSDPVGTTARARIYASLLPTTVLRNGIALPTSSWSYNASEGVLDVKGLGSGTVLVKFG